MQGTSAVPLLLHTTRGITLLGGDANPSPDPRSGADTGSLAAVLPVGEWVWPPRPSRPTGGGGGSPAPAAWHGTAWSRSWRAQLCDQATALFVFS